MQLYSFMPPSFSTAEVCLWAGITKGPPARLKFLEPAVVVSALEDALKTDVK